MYLAIDVIHTEGIGIVVCLFKNLCKPGLEVCLSAIEISLNLNFCHTLDGQGGIVLQFLGIYRKAQLLAQFNVVLSGYGFPAGKEVSYASLVSIEPRHNVLDSLSGLFELSGIDELFCITGVVYTHVYGQVAIVHVAKFSCGNPDVLLGIVGGGKWVPPALCRLDIQHYIGHNFRIIVREVDGEGKLLIIDIIDVVFLFV